MRFPSATELFKRRDRIEKELISTFNAVSSSSLTSYIKELLSQRATEKANRTALSDAFEEATRHTEMELWKRWVSHHDERVRPEHMEAHGQEVPYGSPFTVGGWNMQFPGDRSTAPPEMVMNCRCVVETFLKEKTVTVRKASAAFKSMTINKLDTSKLTAATDDTDETIPPPSDVVWTGILATENELTGDGRLLQADSIDWGELPIPLRYSEVDNGGHDGAVVVGQILDVWRDEDFHIRATGTLDMGRKDAAEMHRLLSENRANGISVDLDNVSFEVRVREELVDSDLYDADLDADEDGRVKVTAQNSDDEVMITTSARLRAATLVAIPAFAGASIQLLAADDENEDDLVEEDEAIAMIAEEDPVAPGDADDEELDDPSGNGEDVTDDDAPDADPDLDDDEIDDDDDDDKKKKKKKASSQTQTFNWVDDVGGLPPYIREVADALMRDHGFREGHAIATAVNAIKRWARGGKAAKGGKSRVKAKTIAKAATALAQWHTKRARAKALALTAATAPLPPRDWFTNPQLDGPTPIHVTDEGRVYGHLALWETCHLSFDNMCVNPPSSPSNYRYFHTGLIATSSGDVPVGHLTVDTGHAASDLGPRKTMAHYDNSGTSVAYVQAGEDDHGIWVSGTVRSDITDTQLATLKASPLSGDWRGIGGELELVAALAVNVPGFPVPHGLAASGAMTSLIAAGAFVVEEDNTTTAAAHIPADDVKTLSRWAEGQRILQASNLKSRMDKLTTKHRVHSMAQKRKEHHHGM